MDTVDAARLKAGVDHPENLTEFDQFFPDEPVCVRYLERIRWREGFVCPKCSGGGEPWFMKRGLHLCRACRAQTSVTAGTIFGAVHRKP